MTEHKDDFEAHPAAGPHADAAASQSVPAPADSGIIGCTCTPDDSPCQWCSMTEEERERRRSAHAGKE